MEPDISTLRKTGHFYFALTGFKVSRLHQGLSGRLHLEVLLRGGTKEFSTSQFAPLDHRPAVDLPQIGRFETSGWWQRKGEPLTWPEIEQSVYFSD